MNQTTALLVTLGIEIPIMVLIAAAFRTHVKTTLFKVGVVACAASLVTHPFAWWANQELTPMLSFGPRAAIIEAGVILAEMAILAYFASMRWRVALMASFIANMSSFGLGLVWFYWLR